MKTIELFQWDLNKQIPCSFPEAHFACVGSEDALIVKANGGNVSIPNILLQEGKDIMVWMMEDGAVADSGRIRIVTRAKPADYIYTETEVITFESLVAKVEDVIAKGNAATGSATTAAQKADSAANKANAASDKAAQVEAEIKASEARRVEAEQGRAEAEATRAAHESERTESFNTNLTSWNSKVDAACKKATDTASKAAQDAKTATDAAIAKNEEATNAAVAKADKASASATTAANKAEAAVSKLPLPLGNTLKGEVESTMVSVHDAYPAPLVTTKVMGQSNQTTTTGKNLFNWDLYIGDYAFDTSASGQGFYFAKIQVGAGKTVAVSVDKVVASGEYLAFADGKFGENKKAIWLAHNSVAVKNGTLTPDAEGNVWIWFGNSKQNIQRLYDTGVKVQVEIGTKATTYEPYTGGKPSPSPDYPQEITNLNKAELVITGKNLINVGTIQSNGFNVRFNDAEILSELNKLPRNIPLWFSCNVEPKGTSNGEIWFEGEGNISLGVMRQGKAYTLPEGEIKSFRLIGGVNDASTRTYSNIQIAAAKSDFTNSDKAKHTPIDLQGNELCSLPNGIKDEVVIDAEGNVSLIKRVAKIDALTVNLKFMQKQNNNKWVAFKSFPDITSGSETKGAISSKFIHKYMLEDGAQYGNFTITTDGNLCFGIPESLCPKEGDWASVTPEVNAWFDGLKEGLLIYASYKKPQTIPLGKVELPALPEATSNVWNDGNIPANVYVQYLKDVNIAYTDLENQIKQITAALSVMDTPTVIPEMAWGTPAAI